MMKFQLLSLLEPYGQSHLLDFWDALGPDEQATLSRQIEQIDFAELARLVAERNAATDWAALAARAESPPAIRLPDPTAERQQAARQRGIEALRQGRVGAILVSGGQGSRLGFEQPKGMYPIGPLSGKSLFELHAEKIAAAARRYDTRIPLCVMTSPATHDETVAFFAAHGNFGLPDDDVLMFRQGTMPAVDARTHRVLLESPGRIALSPDGHGGMLAAITRHGTLEKMLRRGIRHLFYFQVDNPLVDVCGPELIGHHLLAESEMTTQVVAKRDPLERVGNVAMIDGRMTVIEYSDLPDEAARLKNPDGSLKFWAGSIAVHVFDANFLRRWSASTNALPFHMAKKIVPHVDSSGEPVEPQSPNALKFERFIFDLMPLARNPLVVEVAPADGFAPLKNAPGAKQDTPAWVQERMMNLHRRWLRQAGAEVADDVPVEISPLWALDAEEATAKIAPGTRITQATYFQP
jgi:UDP-N-acetylglucosamine/UDP-N-acetylgalactosamine diphosphorylase